MMRRARSCSFQRYSAVLKLTDLYSRSAFMWDGMYYRLSVTILNCMYPVLKIVNVLRQRLIN